MHKTNLLFYIPEYIYDIIFMIFAKNQIFILIKIIYQDI
jgi:hypothetical protein